MKKQLVELWKRISNTKSILAITGAVVILLQQVGFEVNAPYVNEVVKTACGLAVLLGILNDKGMKTLKFNK